MDDTEKSRKEMKRHTFLLMTLVVVDFLAMGAAIRGMIEGIFIGRDKWWTIGSFLTLWLMGAFCFVSDTFQRISETHPQGLSTRITGLRRWKMVSKCLFFSAFAIAMAIGVFHAFYTGYDGVIESYPVVEYRENYFLNSHGDLTEVSRERYVVVGTSGVAAYCGICLTFQIGLLHFFFYNDPKLNSEKRKRWHKKKKPKEPKRSNVYKSYYR